MRASFDAGKERAGNVRDQVELTRLDKVEDRVWMDLEPGMAEDKAEDKGQKQGGPRKDGDSRTVEAAVEQVRMAVRKQ